MRAGMRHGWFLFAVLAWGCGPRVDSPATPAKAGPQHAVTAKANISRDRSEGVSSSELAETTRSAQDGRPEARASADSQSGENAPDPEKPSAGSSEDPSTSSPTIAPRRSEEPLMADWPRPLFVLAISGRQHGYIEPCGCTGLANQKGGLARRHTFLKGLEERGWPVVAVDAGNQVRRFGRQAEIKFQISVEALRKMHYAASTFGPDDLQLTIDELAATTAQVGESETAFVSANVAILDREFIPRSRTVSINGKTVGLTAVLGDEARRQIRADEILTEPALDGLQQAWKELAAQSCDYTVLVVQGTREETEALARAVPHFDIVVTTGGGEIPAHVLQPIDGTPSQLVQVGAKGMYVSLVGFYDDAEQPLRYQRVPLDARFADSETMLDLMATYQQQLERLGLEGLGVRPLPHPQGHRFVGSEVCGDCHSKAFDVWKHSKHAMATESLIHPSERTRIARHFDPECLSCHVTGWNPQRFVPYESGYLSLTETPRMLGSGCENCHGPGSAHVEAEQGDADDATRTALRAEMRLLLADAEKKCMECHDLDNSPDFHDRGAFEKYWKQIEHRGKD